MNKSLALCICLILGSCLLTGYISNEGPATPTEVPADSAITKLWTLDLQGDVAASPLTVQGGVCVITREYIYLLSEEGDLRWSISNDYVDPITDGTSLFIAYWDGVVEKRSCETGEVLASLGTENARMDFATDGTLLYCVSEEDNTVACYDLSGV